MGLGPCPAHADLSHQGEDIPEVTGLEARVLHHLQQQVRRGLGQGPGSEGVLAVHFSQVELAQTQEVTESSTPG